MHPPQPRKEFSEIDLYVVRDHLAEKVAEVIVLIVRQDCNNLIMMTEGSDQRANAFAIPQVVKQLKFILNTGRTARDVYLFDGDIFRLCLSSTW